MRTERLERWEFGDPEAVVIRRGKTLWQIMDDVSGDRRRG